ncbi:hypothetical protein K470DRAFT_270661 [Piedraia hortae CBS 480.64]|uniref:Uncharacterized protein n=1 Tax=Piedraia hortae CBS 480.64 TaxID=1314780 RepID=A0A6A7BZJ5_9PEZI|nr:hypothetical protein K470DRAFT_270661 [Piedraia hortae CBS 480.64]
MAYEISSLWNGLPNEYRDDFLGLALGIIEIHLEKAIRELSPNEVMASVDIEKICTRRDLRPTVRAINLETLRLLIARLKAAAQAIGNEKSEEGPDFCEGIEETTSTPTYLASAESQPWPTISRSSGDTMFASLLELSSGSLKRDAPEFVEVSELDGTVLIVLEYADGEVDVVSDCPERGAPGLVNVSELDGTMLIVFGNADSEVKGALELVKISTELEDTGEELSGQRGLCSETPRGIQNEAIQSW